MSTKSIEPGVYNINNNNNGWALMMFSNDAEGIPMTCASDPNGQTVSSVHIYAAFGSDLF